MTMRRCLTCPTLIDHGSRCPACEAPRARARLAKWGPVRKARLGLSGGAWQTIRKRILDRDGHVCQGCGAPCPHPEHHHVDHIAGLGSNADDNLRTMCASCNYGRAKRGVA